ncbi:nuclear transport factor 2 family protein [Polaribacter sejongensis]|uniref:nuclear transport factor 2 family protein n=1 Tax=Polaribacter sejongensis TaxID=985043 RepID=UPI001AD7FE02|nr:nuclear transport factor 2 family protein [Polaribacter sejongensis]
MDSFLEPFRKSILIKVLLFLAMLFYNFVLNAQVDTNSALFKTLKSKDSIIFKRAFNNCEVEKISPIIADNFEFYHDVGGIQNKAEFIDTIKKNLCTNPGNNTRQLVANSLEVYQLNNNGVIYGAIQKGKHTFQQKQKGVLKLLELQILHTFGFLKIRFGN